MEIRNFWSTRESTQRWEDAFNAHYIRPILEGLSKNIDEAMQGVACDITDEEMQAVSSDITGEEKEAVSHDITQGIKYFFLLFKHKNSECDT